MLAGRFDLTSFSKLTFGRELTLAAGFEPRC
jgi:hypothetical protein